MKYITLNNGVRLPSLGFGTWCIDNAKAAEAVRTATELGYRHIDTAQAYGNERGVGEGVRTCGVPREELFVASKVAAELKTYNEAKKSIDETLEKMGLGDKADAYPCQLSGGQQQRVALARTLTQSPHIILADEPVAALDPVTAKQVMQDFVHINQELGISILLNIHHVELALEYADRIIGIRAGKIVYDGPSARVDQAVLDSIYGEQGGAEECV